MRDSTVDLPTVAVQVTFILLRWQESVPTSRTSSRCLQGKIPRWGALKDTSVKHDKNGSFRSHQIIEKFMTKFMTKVLYSKQSLSSISFPTPISFPAFSSVNFRPASLHSCTSQSCAIWALFKFLIESLRT